MNEPDSWHTTLTNWPDKSGKTFPPCPKCGGEIVDDSGFLYCGCKCTNCEWGCGDGGLA